jgi:anti-sigma factor RsiW
MNCDEIRRHWHLYHDSEGDAELHWRINEHLGTCPTCAEWCAKQSRFEDLLCQKLATDSADGELWASVLGSVGLVRAKPARRWVLFSSLAACAAAILLLVGASWYWLTGENNASPSLSSLTAEWHNRLTSGQEPFAFRSESDLEVEDYLRQEVTFQVRCPPRKDSGFAVEGAGTCQFAGESAAVVIGHVDRAPVSIVILSRDSLATFPHQRAALQGEAIHRCREGELEMALSVIDRNLVLVVGRAPAESLLRVLRAYGTYPHERT